MRPAEEIMWFVVRRGGDLGWWKVGGSTSDCERMCKSSGSSSVVGVVGVLGIMGIVIGGVGLFV